MLPIITALLPMLGTVVDKVIPDKDAAEKAKNELASTVLQNSAQIEQAAASVVLAEAKSDNWLVSSWRPVTALIFVALIVARWLGYTAPGMTEQEYLEVYGIIKIMIGGYVVSRGAEKGIKVWKGK
jgi:hypothetical protein